MVVPESEAVVSNMNLLMFLIRNCYARGIRHQEFQIHRCWAIVCLNAERFAAHMARSTLPHWSEAADGALPARYALRVPSDPRLQIGRPSATLDLKSRVRPCGSTAGIFKSTALRRFAFIMDH